MRALVYVDAAGLELTRASKDKSAATFLELVAMLIDDRGVVVKRDQQAYRVRGGEQAVAGGLVYRLDVPVKAPGPYGLRVAAREIATNKFGTANQFVIVPDLTRKRLTLSGVVLSASEGDRGSRWRRNGDASGAASIRDAGAAGLQLSRLQRAVWAGDGEALAAGGDRLLRDGKPVYTAPPVAIKTDAKPGEPARVVGTLSLGPQTAPGDYALAVTVTDALASKDQASATSVTDFTVVQPPGPTP